MSAKTSPFRRLLFVAALLPALSLAVRQPASAVPIFAERYGFQCSACHTALPELNAFGNAFRRNGFQLPGVPRHREFPLALRFQETYVKDLQPAQTRRFNALGILISTANFGSNRSYSYFARYLLGSQGAAGSLFYAWVQHVSPSTGIFERLGLFQLPLIANPTQRLDTITVQPVYAYTVGHSAANLATPRLGALFGRRTDRIDAEISIAGDEYHGSAYGAPAPPSDLQQSFSQPEVFGTATWSLFGDFKAGLLGLEGARSFRSRTSGAAFNDAYGREGLQAGWTHGRFDVAAQQLWGHDSNADGLGNGAASSGGFLTMKYRPSAHSYVGLRYDAAANPFATRDIDLYGALSPTIHSRLVIEHLEPIGPGRATPVTSAQLLFALPFAEPSKPH